MIQFSGAEFLGANKYILSGVKRNMFNSSISEKEKRFILLDNNLQKLGISEQQIGKKQEFTATSIGHNIEQSEKFEFMYEPKL